MLPLILPTPGWHDLLLFHLRHAQDKGQALLKTR